MTTNHHHSPDDHDDDPTIDPLRPDHLQCPCGATADRTGWCRKCRARARWDRRTAGRMHADRTPTRPGSPPASRRPRNRRAAR
jgi:hypothetical protein